MPVLRRAEGRMNRPTRDAVYRILDTRRRINALMWAARAEVVRSQLQQMRATAP